MKKTIIMMPAVLAISAALFIGDPGSLPLAMDIDDKQVHTDIMKYGYPDTASLRYYDGFVLSYDGRNRTAFWVAERLNIERLEGTAKQSGLSFRIDQSFSKELRSTNSDYINSGFDRGHLAAAANHPGSRDDVRATMIYSNASPQHGYGFNQHLWKWLEEDTREWAKNVDDLYVYTGPAYRAPDPTPDSEDRMWVRYELIGENYVAVPTHFFKVMVAEIDGQLSRQAFLIPNKPVDIRREDVQWTNYLVAIDDIESITGLDFLNVLDERVQKNLKRTRRLKRGRSRS